MTKKDKKMRKELTPKDFGRMWGEDGPYSQVRLCEETRILHDGISRIFLVVEAEINPFTFEYVADHRQKFASDEAVQQLFDHAEYRGKLGYVVSAGEVEIREEGAWQFARKQADAATQTLIRMHRFVMDELGLTGNGEVGVIMDDASRDGRLVWNQRTGRIEKGVDDELWDNTTAVKTLAGIHNNNMWFFIVFAFIKGFAFKKVAVELLAKALQETAERFRVQIENCESFTEYLLITALLPFDVAPADFIETALGTCNKTTKKPIFQKDYFVTNVKKPTPEQIMSFLKQLSLDKDIEMPS